MNNTPPVPPPLPPLPGDRESNHAAPGPIRSVHVQLPEEILPKTIPVLDDLALNTAVLEGIYESSEVAAIIHSRQASTAVEYEQRAQSLLDLVNEKLSPLQASTQAKITHAKGLESEWLQVESEMYRALQPFSLPTLQNRMDQAVIEAESVSDTLANSFLDKPSQASDLDSGVAEFIKSYMKERKLYHMRKERQDRWKEERVGRAF